MFHKRTGICTGRTIEVRHAATIAVAFLVFGCTTFGSSSPVLEKDESTTAAYPVSPQENAYLADAGSLPKALTYARGVRIEYFNMSRRLSASDVYFDIPAMVAAVGGGAAGLFGAPTIGLALAGAGGGALGARTYVNSTTKSKILHAGVDGLQCVERLGQRVTLTAVDDAALGDEVKKLVAFEKGLGLIAKWVDEVTNRGDNSKDLGNDITAVIKEVKAAREKGQVALQGQSLIAPTIYYTTKQIELQVAALFLEGKANVGKIVKDLGGAMAKPKAPAAAPTGTEGGPEKPQLLQRTPTETLFADLGVTDADVRNRTLTMPIENAIRKYLAAAKALAKKMTTLAAPFAEAQENIPKCADRVKLAKK